MHGAGFSGEVLCLFARYLTRQLGISAAFYDASFVIVLISHFSIGLVVDS
jgi:hypothetical protein